MSTFLKVQVKALAHEAKTLKQAERHTLARGRALKGKVNRKHAKGETPAAPSEENLKMFAWAKGHPEEAIIQADEAYVRYWGLTHYRKNVVRKEARSTHLAYGFLRGHNYDEIEFGSYEKPDWTRIEQLAVIWAENEDPRDVKQRFEEWYQKAVFIE